MPNETSQDTPATPPNPNKKPSRLGNLIASFRHAPRTNKMVAIGAAIVIVILGTVLLIARGAGPFASNEAENSSIKTPATSVNDSSASAGGAVKFGSGSGGGGGGGNVQVSTAAQLTAALTNAKPGDVINMADGTYSSKFVSTASGTASAPITLKGSRNAIIDGGSLGGGYAFQLGVKNSTNTVSYWKLMGFSLMGAQKGIIFDNVQHSVIDGLYVHDVGEEGIHLRDFSSNNVIQNTTVTKTGQDVQAYGEGIYIGSAVSNWSSYSQGKADFSNNNQILNNTISYTGAENMDIKEGTHGGIIRGNSLDGHGMCWQAGKDCNFGDSLIDMKGEGWQITNNTATYVHAVWKDNGQADDGFQVHTITSGNAGPENSGKNNVFSGNHISDVVGYGFNIQSGATGTVVKCDNVVTGAGKGFGNVTCTN